MLLHYIDEQRLTIYFDTLLEGLNNIIKKAEMDNYPPSVVEALTKEVNDKSDILNSVRYDLLRLIETVDIKLKGENEDDI